MLTKTNVPGNTGKKTNQENLTQSYHQWLASTGSTDTENNRIEYRLYLQTDYLEKVGQYYQAPKD